MNDMKSAELLIAQGMDVPIFYVVPDPAWAVGLETLLSQYYVICADDSAMVTALQKTGIQVYCAQRELGPAFDQIKRSSSGLLQLKSVQNFIRQKSGDSRPNILVFKTSPALEKKCSELGYRLLAAESRLNRRFEDKISLSLELHEMDAGLIPNRIGRVADFDYQTLARDLGPTLVAQFSRGFAGNSTYFLSSSAEYRDFALKQADRRVKFSRYIAGRTLTVDACVTESGIIHSHYFLQIMGQTDFNRFAGGTAGNDYAYRYDLSAQMESNIRSLIVAMGQRMKAAGYRGVFGLDLVLDEAEDRAYIIENNARLVASIPVFTQLQMAQGELPLLVVHLAELLHLPYTLDAQSLNESLWHHYEASQLILRNTEEETIHINADLKSGIYPVRDLPTNYNPKPGYRISDLGSEQEYLLSVVPKGRDVMTNIECAHLLFRRGIMTSGQILDPVIRDLAISLKKSCNSSLNKN